MGDTPQEINERMGHTVIGPEATDDQVQDVVDAADGKLDGDIRNAPETDLQSALYIYDNSKQDVLAKLELAYWSSLALARHGEHYGNPQDMARIAVILGSDVMSLVGKLVSMVG